MIVWIASYPRSGNTLLRMILKSVFGVETYSKYDDITAIGKDKDTAELVGHRMLEGDWEGAYQKMKQSEELFFVKTHDYPEDDSRALYIVREGRASIVSYRHYLKDFKNKENSLPDIIAGFVDFGSWGSHLDAWNPVHRPNTLLIQYERLLSNPGEEVERMSDFLGIKPAGQWKNDFEYFHKINPQFFRKGDSSRSLQEIQGEDLEMFWLFHGDWMRNLNYCDPDEEKKYSLPLLRGMIKSRENALKARLDKVIADRDAVESERDALRENALKARLDKVIAHRDALNAHRDVLKAERDALKAERDTLKADRDALKAEKDALKAERNALKAERDTLKAENKLLRFERDAARIQCDALSNSLSWRITGPLRHIAGLLKRK